MPSPRSYVPGSAEDPGFAHHPPGPLPASADRSRPRSLIRAAALLTALTILGAAAGCGAAGAGTASAEKAASTTNLASASAGSSPTSAATAPGTTGATGMTPSSTNNVLTAAPMYVNPSTPAAAVAAQVRQTQPNTSRMVSRLANTSSALWVDGTWSTAKVRVLIAVYLRRAKAQHRVAVIVIFNIPGSHGDRYSGYQGASSASAYRKWVSQAAAGTQGFGANVTVILEPGALASLENLSRSQQQTRYSLLRYAAKQFVSRGVTTYMDAGDPSWHNSAVMAPRLKQAWVPGLRGFSVNVAAFVSTTDATKFGAHIVAALHVNIHFVIDTSRNGRSTTGAMSWSCNPSNMGIGSAPTTQTGNALTDALLWIKNPGTSDGTCNGGPPAGKFWTKAAVTLVINVTIVVNNPTPTPTVTPRPTVVPTITPTTAPTLATVTPTAPLAPTPVPTVPITKW